MTTVCSTYICIAPEGLGLSGCLSYLIGGGCTLAAATGFVVWYKKTRNRTYEKI